MTNVTEQAWHAVYSTINYCLPGWFKKNPNALTALEKAVLAIIYLNERANFQQKVKPWLDECFGPEVAGDREERNHRFLEESLELVQSCGITCSEAHRLVDYVFGRQVGEKSQEVGGVMVTLAGLCLANGMNMHACGMDELDRVKKPEVIEKIRMKQATKPGFNSPLPGKS